MLCIWSDTTTGVQNCHIIANVIKSSKTEKSAIGKRIVKYSSPLSKIFCC